MALNEPKLERNECKWTEIEFVDTFADLPHCVKNTRYCWTYPEIFDEFFAKHMLHIVKVFLILKLFFDACIRHKRGHNARQNLRIQNFRASKDEKFAIKTQNLTFGNRVTKTPKKTFVESPWSAKAAVLVS